MQCVNCQFENMPGTAACVRCGTSMVLASSALAIYPPRATRWRKTIRRWLPFRQLLYPMHNGLLTAGQATAGRISRELYVHLPPARAILRMIAPGWAHAFLGHWSRGRYFTYAWLGALAVGTLSFGSTIGAIALGLAFVAHSSSILDLLLQSNERTARSIMLVGLVTFVGLLALYIPIGRTVLTFVNARTLLIAGSPLQAGDNLVFVPRTAGAPLPPPGTIVLFRNAPFRIDGGMRGGHRRVVQAIDGEWADRVIAGPGSTVRLESGKLTVDGQPSAYLPLNPDKLPATLDISVPPESVCILPTTNSFLEVDAIGGQCIIPRSHLVGRVLVRNSPFWRFWWMQ